MKKAAILLIAIVLFPIIGHSQNSEGLEFISPFHDGVAAVKKGKQWAFINADGTIVVDFRADLVPTTSGDSAYPIFNSDRCLIKQVIDGIPYYGYIDKTGVVSVKPQFLNATNFNTNSAIALKLIKVDLGENGLVGKEMYLYKYFETTIDVSGEIKTVLTEEETIGLIPKNFRTPLAITSKFISEHLIATKSKDTNLWYLKKID
ncbi:WG repeat-containing protein [Psychroserpens sp. NJDZ02]|uniref:WG repeat-containing protein n=1 Tax=Psychroserpens sp. NJDZ02 TaxID=2570561 RepID=UPI0010A79015|nr:WG repeat-containing protein [Psychroserpens sp. NJDZ02]QCE43344.1 WG repeat-containing protein [Psychroserpens sp. NJDZ02]